MKAAKALVRYYKQCINPLIGGVCKYVPSCSAYYLQSVSEYGLVIGGIKGLGRIARCNPWAKGGFDPVKTNYRGRAKWLL